MVSLTALKPKVFTFDVGNFPECEVIQTESDGRRYITPQGNVYDSTTTFLNKHMDKSGIEKWRDWKGHEKADAIRDRAADRGTQLHGNLERMLKGEPLEASAYFRLLKRFEPTLKANLGTIKAIENCLYSDHMKLAGRVDLMGLWKNEFATIDFKGADRIKKEVNITSYFLQTTIYSLMHYDMTDIMPTKIVLLICPEKETYLQVFEKSPLDYVEQVEKFLGFKTKWSLDNP
jgi:hypothetical protein